VQQRLHLTVWRIDLANTFGCLACGAEILAFDRLAGAQFHPLNLFDARLLGGGLLLL
jgi:hypothetical protein